LAGGGLRTALIPNALDGLDAQVRAAGLDRDLHDLHAVGLDVTVLDLRQEGSLEQLSDYDIVWVRGGNVFVLRRVLADTGADDQLVELLRCDAMVYGGFSAGACVLAPDLNGLEQVDDVTAVVEPLMSGLALLDRPFVPHVRSPIIQRPLLVTPSPPHTLRPVSRIGPCATARSYSSTARRSSSYRRRTGCRRSGRRWPRGTALRAERRLARRGAVGGIGRRVRASEA
jgi:hypothetical protein